MAWCMHSYLLIAQSSGFYHLRGILKHIVTFYNYERVLKTNYQSANSKGTWLMTVLPNISPLLSSPPIHCRAPQWSNHWIIPSSRKPTRPPKLAGGSYINPQAPQALILLYLPWAMSVSQNLKPFGPAVWSLRVISTLVWLPLCWGPTRASRMSSCH